MKKLLSLILVCASTMVMANDHDKAKHHGKPAHHGTPQHQGTINISPQLRAVLNQEMQQIKGGMESLVLANVSGNWGKIASIGHQIKHSYIMKQKLTDKQRHELHESLPMEFKMLDKKLHQYAGMLAHVAKEHDIELVNYYIYKMNETCVSCHASFASNKFPGFKAPNKHATDNH
jgi:hypothetical protein